MSELPADALHYQAVVAEFFLGLKGSGLLLSPLDQELVAEWERRGLPVAVVCRGIRSAVEQRLEDGGGRVRSLRSIRHAVEGEWRAYRSGRVGDAPAPEGEQEAAARRLAQARELLTHAASGAPAPLGAAYLVASRRLETAAGEPGAPLERVEAALAAADEGLLAAWLHSLPRSERSALGPRVRALAGRRSTGESRRGYHQTLRTYLVDLARQAGLTLLRGSV